MYAIFVNVLIRQLIENTVSIYALSVVVNVVLAEKLMMDILTDISVHMEKIMKVLVKKKIPTLKGKKAPVKGKIYEVLDYDHRRNMALIKEGSHYSWLFVNQKRVHENEAEIIEN